MTLIVLLILAAVSLSSVFSEKGIFSRAEKATIWTEISKVEEIGNLVYVNDMIEKKGQTLEKEKVKENIIEAIEMEGYKVKIIKENGIVDIKLDKENIKMISNSSTNIGIEYIEGENCIYYLELRGNYYKINFFKDEVISINKEASTMQGNNEVSYNLSANPLKNLITIENITDNSIEVKSGNLQGEDEITVNYGDITKKCNVTISNEVGAMDADNFVGKYFMYPAGNGKQILCYGLYEASEERNAEIVSYVSLGKPTVSGYDGWTAYESIINEIISPYQNKSISKTVRCFGNNLDGSYTASDGKDLDFAIKHSGEFKPTVGNIIFLGSKTSNKGYYYVGIWEIGIQFENNVQLDYFGQYKQPGDTKSVAYDVLGVFSLNDDVKIVSGSGTKENPFVIKDN